MALVVFIHAQLPQKAMVALERSLLWRDLFDLAIRENLEENELQDMAYRVAGVFKPLKSSTTIDSKWFQMICSRRRGIKTQPRSSLITLRTFARAFSLSLKEIYSRRLAVWYALSSFTPTVYLLIRRWPRLRCTGSLLSWKKSSTQPH